jgi:hypothetical protein
MVVRRDCTGRGDRLILGPLQRQYLAGDIQVNAHHIGRKPEIVGANSTNNALGSTSINYDPFGRRYFVGLSMAF